METSKTNNQAKHSDLVSLKTAFFTAGGFFAMALFTGIGLVSSNSFNAIGASLINSSSNLDTKNIVTPVFLQTLTMLGAGIVALFLAIFVLYILAKTEGQRHGDKYYSNTRSYAYKNFPSIFMIESLTMLYVVLIIITSTVFIAKLNLTSAESNYSDNFKIFSSIAFAILGGALSQLYYFLNKVQPQNITEDALSTKSRKMVEFDINKVLRYLSFPFMSGGMGILAYTLVKGSGSILGMESFSNPSYWFLMLMALTAGYFSDLFVIIFHRIIKNIEDKIPDGDDKPFEVKKIDGSQIA